MKKVFLVSFIALVISFAIINGSLEASIIDAPHNETNLLDCGDCYDPHFHTRLNWHLSAPGTDFFLIIGDHVAGDLDFVGDGTYPSPRFSTFQYSNITINASGWDNNTASWNAKNGIPGRGLFLAFSISDPFNTLIEQTLSNGTWPTRRSSDGR